MKTNSKFRMALGLALCVLALFLMPACCRVAGDLVLPEPGGPYRVATLTLELKDVSRLETLTESPQDMRELMVQLWYPTEAASIEPVPYMNDALAALAQKEYFMPKGFQTKIVTHSGAGLPPAQSACPMPVLLFSHGLGETREAYTVFFEYLASRGYAVAAVNHTYAAALTVFSDGRAIPYGLEEPESVGMIPSRHALEEYARRSQEFHDRLLAIWTGDLRFVLDSLVEINEGVSNGLLNGAFDMGKTGVFGHSFGGAAAAECLLEDTRFRAAANLDGSLWGDAAQSPVARPFLMINHPPAYQFDGTRQYLFEHSLAEAINMDIAKTGHMNFSDEGVLLDHFLSPWWRLFVSKEELGRIDPRRALAISNAYLCAFFDKELKGLDSPLLQDATAEFPEVALVTNP